MENALKIIMASTIILALLMTSATFVLARPFQSQPLTTVSDFHNAESLRGGRITIGGIGPAPQICRGDLNFDGRVDNFDIDRFNAVYNYPTEAQALTPELFVRADMNNDNAVNDIDSGMFLARILNGSHIC